VLCNRTAVWFVCPGWVFELDSVVYVCMIMQKELCAEDEYNGSGSRVHANLR
jgi:hypothetical protein